MTNETEVKSVALSHAGHSAAAKALAQAFAQSPVYQAFHAEMQEVFKRTEENVIASLRFFELLHQGLGKEKLAASPIPDSTKETSNNPDKYETKEGKVNSWFDFCETLPDGIEIREALEGIKAALAHRTDAPKQWLDMPKLQLQQAQGTWNQRLKKLRDNVKLAVKVAHNFYAIEDNQTTVVARIAKDVIGKNEDGTNILRVRNTTKPIIIKSTVEGEDEYIEPFSIPTFADMDVMKAIKAGGSFKDFKALVSRGPKLSKAEKTAKKIAEARQALKEAGATDAPEASEIRTLDTFIGYLQKMSGYVDSDTAEGLAHQGKLVETMASPGGQELLITFGDFMMASDSLWSKVEAAYRVAKDRQIAANLAAASQNGVTKEKREAVKSAFSKAS